MLRIRPSRLLMRLLMHAHIIAPKSVIAAWCHQCYYNVQEMASTVGRPDKVYIYITWRPLQELARKSSSCLCPRAYHKIQSSVAPDNIGLIIGRLIDSGWQNGMHVRGHES